MFLYTTHSSCLCLCPRALSAKKDARAGLSDSSYASELYAQHRIGTAQQAALFKDEEGVRALLNDNSKLPDFVLARSLDRGLISVEVKRVYNPVPRSVNRAFRRGVDKLTPDLLDRLDIQLHVVCLVVPCERVAATMAALRCHATQERGVRVVVSVLGGMPELFGPP